MSIDDDRLERDLAAALRRGADRIEPTDQLDAILRTAREDHFAEVRPLRRRGTWLAAAASAAVVAGGLWAVGTRPADDGVVASGDRTSATTTLRPPPSTGSTSPSGVGPSAPLPPGTGVVPATPVVVPVYALGLERPGGPEVLVRTFDRVLSIGSARTATLQDRVAAALEQSTFRSAASGLIPEGVGRDVSARRVTEEADRVRVELDQTPRLEAAQAQRLLAAWVRTVQGVLGKGDLPVELRTTDGSPLFGHLDADTAWRQSDVAGTALASIWIDGPIGTVAPSGARTASGVASVWEASMQWELLRDGTRVSGGVVTADEGAPARGRWTIELGSLEAGDYVLRLWSTSMKDGSVESERRQAFEVG